MPASFSSNTVNSSRAFSAFNSNNDSLPGPLAQAIIFRAVGSCVAADRKDAYVQTSPPLLDLNRWLRRWAESGSSRIARSWRAKLRTLSQPLPKGKEIGSSDKRARGKKAVVSRPWAGVSSGNMIDEKLLGRITGNPEIFGGKPIIRGMRISVELILSLLAQGEKEETILADYPDLEPDDLRACLAYAHAAISHDKLDSLQIPA